MDSVVYAALEEICSQGVNGMPLRDLWPKLHSSLSSNGLDPSSNVKEALWKNLLNVPCLQFESRGVSYGPQDPEIQSFEESEELKLKIIAAEHIRNSLVGIYDIKASDAGISQIQRRALERLAIARTNGVTQSELAKEFGMKGNNIFYVLRSLECRGLIVRQSTIIRKKEACNEREPKNNSIITTNMLHLHRYAKHLGCQQRLEITKEDRTFVENEDAEGSAAAGDGVSEECVKEDVHVKDYLPALRAICEKLENADGKVLVESDIKRDLGYRGIAGHRAWRNIYHRLKEARVVEEFCGKVNQKEVSCLRLLKKFSPNIFDPKTHGGRNDDVDAEQLPKQGKRGQITDQLVELPIEHQIFDMIDTEGSKGLTITEVCKRLGISNKRYYTRLLDMFSRFGMHLKPESHNRGVAYRVWTPGNYNPEVSNILPSKSEDVLDENGLPNACVGQANSVQTIQVVDHWISKDDTGTNGEYENIAVESGISHGSPIVERSHMLLGSSSSQNLACETSSSVPEAELQIVCTRPVSDVASLEILASTSTPPRRRSYQRYPCLNLNAASIQREQRILEMLQEEKFLIKPELHRQLESLEKDKQTMMDRRTLERSLNKLQQEGHCKCIRVSVPVVTNCGRSRTMDVVLHPSVYNVTPDLLGRIHERLRSFDMQVRCQGSSRLKKGQSIPVLNSIERIQISPKLDVQAERSEAMRANGFVLAKMVRTKLLHIFLWGYLNSLHGWDDALSSGKHGYDQRNPHSTCKLLDLDAAIKAMPLELFLQVAGSTERYEDMVEKCRIGLCISDLPVQEYKSLMDTRATGRLSYLVDILRRLKLIRLVSGELSDASEVPHAKLQHSLELKPYIEEPVAMILPSPGYVPIDLRPHIRHDFVLSNRKAVDEYWNTLEYCYAAADSKAALHAFPGSAVHEVFLFRSWASVRVMTADQRAQLMKRVINEDRNTKLSLKECERIAKDLNLTLEQVLRVYNDKRQNRLNRLQGALNAKSVDIQPRKRKCVSRKRKRSSEGRPMNQVKFGTHDESGEKRRMEMFDVDDQFSEAQKSFTTSSGEHEKHMMSNDIADYVEAIEELESNKDGEDDYSSIRECALSRLKPARRRKFSWTEDADRQLLIEYVRYRAALGAKFHRTDWSSLPNLPAPHVTCRRRMALLNSSIQFRKAVMRLCNKLSERYSKHLEKFQKKSLGDNCGSMIRNYPCQEDFDRNLYDNIDHIDKLNSEEQWDDFNNPDIKIALDEVLQYKQTAKLEAAQGIGSFSEHSGVEVDAEGNDPHETRLVSSATASKEVSNRSTRRKVSTRRSGRHRVPYIKLINRLKGANRRAYESLAVSNAAELFKLVFLSTSTAPEVPNLLAETLRRYSEHDLFAAFNYLRERKIMVGGNGSSPFGLSQPFLQNISSSPFPTNTGNRAVKMASWVHEREKDLLEEGFDLSADLQCGDVFHLCALVSSGEVSISPCLPDEGVGEAEDLRKSKRKSDNNEISGGDKAKKLKTILAGEGEIISRREKGFPGIRLSLSRATISRIDALTFFGDGDFVAFPLSGNDQGNISSTLSFGHSSSSSDTMKETLDSWGAAISKSVAGMESPWEAMNFYASHLVSLSSNQERGSPFHPNLFKTVYSAIQKAGDQGLSMEGISRVTDTQGEKMPELIVEVLEAFGRALKVNAYDTVHVVDPLYRSKYFLTSMSGLRQDVEADLCKGASDDEPLLLQPENYEDNNTNLQKDISINAEEMHRVTILNHPEEMPQHLSEIQSINESYEEAKVISPRRDRGDEMSECHIGDSPFCRPILPWINGDGTINEIVYKGLVRRILGIVMQNPGIVEANVLSQMGVLNPQSCRKLLELMILDNHIIARKMYQATSAGAPAILGRLLGSNFKKPKLICRVHFFTNPMSVSFL